jgi:H+-transporting ATPase
LAAVEAWVHFRVSIPKDDLKSLPLSEVEKQFGTSPDGLSQGEATKLLAQYGPQ